MMLSMAALFAQAPQKMSYQAVVRNSSNTLVTNQNVSAKISILQGSVNGAPVYVETHTTATNANGLLTLEVGEGSAVSGSMASINWAEGPFFLKSEIDPEGGINYSIEGTQQLLSVPYALYAEKAGNVPAFSITPVDTTGYMISITQPGQQPQAFFLPTGGIQGEQGPQGLPGESGRGISSITGPVSNGNVDTYTIHYTDTTTSTFTVTNGTDGQDGQDGNDGQDGQDGFSPTISVVQGSAGMVLTITDVNGTNQYTIPVATGEGGSGTFVQQQVNWSDTDQTSVSYILNKPNLAPVATSGSYNDLTDKPTIPNVTEIQQTLDTLQQVVNNMPDMTDLPTNMSDLENDMGYITAQDIQQYIPETFEQVQADWNETDTTSAAYIKNKPETVGATSIEVTQSDNGYMLIVTQPDGQSETITVRDGVDGNDGEDGEDGAPGRDGRGIVSITGPSQSADNPNVDTYTIMYSDTTYSTFNVTNGTNGQDGVSPTISLRQSDNGMTVVVTDATGEHTYTLPAGGGQGSFTQLPANWSETNQDSPQYIQNKPNFATVATSGDYNDLINTPDIDQLNQRIDTLQSIVTVLPEIPNNMSDLENDLGFITEQDIQQYIPDVTGLTNDVTNIQNTLDTMQNVVNNLQYTVENMPAQVKSDWNEMDTSSLAFIKNKPTNLSDFTDDMGYITEQNIQQYVPDVTGLTNNVTNIQNTLDTMQNVVNNLQYTVENMPAQVKSDWNETDTSSAAYIRNKPEITQGAPGADGRSIVSITGPSQQSADNPNVDTYTIMYSDNTTSTFTVTNGVNGQDGFSPTISIRQSDNGMTVVVTDATGEHTYTLPAGGGQGTFTQLPANWTETNEDSPQFIMNKPTNVSAFQNDAGYISEQNIQQYMPYVPENVSEFENDAEYITADDLEELLPEIPAQVKSDWNEYDTSSVAFIKNKPFNVSAFENDAAYISEQTIQQYLPIVPENVSAFENDAEYITAEDLPVNVSELENDAEYITAEDLEDLLPEIPAQVKSDWTEFDTSSVAFIKHKPTKLSDFYNDQGYISEQNIQQYMPYVPENVSEFENDAEYITAEDLEELLPEIPAQEQSDWEEQNQQSAAYIQNKPTIPSMDDIQSMINNSLGALNDRIDSLRNALNEAHQAEQQNANLTFACGTSKMYDYEGNAYSTVKIGNQCWMKENLRTTHFPDGTEIAAARIPYNGNTPAYIATSLNNLPSCGYNMAAAFHGLPSEVMDNSNYYGQEDEEEGIRVQGICPEGWHLPSYGDWDNLQYTLYENQMNCGQYYDNVAKALADNNTESWRESDVTCAIGSDIASNNASGFSAIGYSLSTYTQTSGGGIAPKTQAIFWTSSPDYEYDWGDQEYSVSILDTVYCMTLTYNSAAMTYDYYGKGLLASVRCVRDEAEGTVQQMQEQIDNLQQQLDNQGDKPDVYINSCLYNSSSSSASVSAEADGNGEILLAKGVCWATHENPTISDNYALSDATSDYFSYAISDLAFGTQYYIRAFATNSNGTSYSSQRTVSSGISLGGNAYVVPANYNATITITQLTDTGSVWVYDNGGPNANYTSDCDGYLVIKPEDNTKKVKLVLGSYITESCCDYIQIYDGTNTTATSGYVNQYKGSGSITPYTSTAADGSLTIRFRSDYSVQKSGFSFLFSMVGSCDGTYSVSYDGYNYQTVEIGDQCWMKENLRNTHYADGTEIEHSNMDSETTAYYDYPNGNANNVATYGLLYNWKAVMHNDASSDANPSGVQGICPNGWHVPSLAEWAQLTDYVSSQSQYVCGSNNTYIAKALATPTGWYGSETTCAVGKDQSGNNATGFSAPPAGEFNDGTYSSFTHHAIFWTSTESGITRAHCNTLSNNYPYVITYSYGLIKDSGYSVRCIKD